MRIVISLAAVALTTSVSRLEPALPAVAEDSLWLGVVKRGPMVREIRGTGTLVPEEIRWITAPAAGRVDRIVLRPGAPVVAGSVILELSNPDLRQAVRSAELDWETAKAQLANQRTVIANARIQQETILMDAEAAHQLAMTDLEVTGTLAEKGMVALFVLRQKQTAAGQARSRLELIRRQMANSDANVAPQLAPAEAAVNQRRAEFERLSRQLAGLRVRSTMDGILQEVNVEVGQQVGAGVNLARVIDPARLKAEVRIAETQARDLVVGQRARIDTLQGVVEGRTTRIDPASRAGTVGVDIVADGPLPIGARPDLGIEASVELERLPQVLFVEAPAFATEGATVSIFRLLPDGQAERVPVRIGRRSLHFVEILDGLSEGDRVVLSDMSSHDGVDRIRIE